LYRSFYKLYTSSQIVGTQGSADFAMAQNLAESSFGKDEYGYRRGFVQLVKAAKTAKALN